MIQKSETRCATSATNLAGLFLALALGGCANNSATRIDARASTVAVGELRMAINFDHVKEVAAPHTGNAIELGTTKSRGSADQSIATGQNPIILGNTTFAGPQQPKSDFDFTYSDLSWRSRFFNEGKFGTEISVGAGFSSIDLKVSSTTQIATQRIENFGVRVGGGLIYRLDSSSSLKANILGYYAPLLDTEIHDIERYELVYAKSFFDNFRLRVGYTYWQVAGYNHNNSDFKLIFSGPIIALDLEF